MSFAKSTSQKREPRAFNAQARKIVFNVHKYLAEQKKKHCLTYSAIKATADATSISSSTISRIIREGRISLATRPSSPVFSTPKKKHGGYNRVKIDCFHEGILRRKIQEFYVEKKECPNFRKILKCLKEENEISCSQESLRKRIHALGFKYEPCQSKRKILVEKPEITAWRSHYLRAVRDFREERRPIVYLGETYIRSTVNMPRCSLSPQESGIKIPITHDNRLMIVNGGGEMGFIKNALMIFKSHSKTGDYHGDMNGTNFMKWVEQQLIPNLPPNSTVVMDNADYHCTEKSKKPNSASIKVEMEKWLTEKGVNYSSNMTKAQLMEIIKSVPTQKEFLLDELLEKHGHCVLRLPPHHPELNPIESVWGYIKSEVNRECTSASLEKKQLFLEKVFKEYSKEMWQECCSHVWKIENEYMKNDELMDKRIDHIIMNSGEATSTSSDGSEDEIED